MEKWKQISRLFEAALGRAPAERGEFLDDACAGDESLREEVVSLLAAHERAGDFMGSAAAGAAASLLASASLAPGSRVGHYEVLGPLGAGGMGEVYLARDERLGRRAALKLLPAHFAADEERVRRFRQEARAASALNHPNIITVYEVGEVEGRFFLATEFVEGMTLRRRMAEGPMPAGEALGVAEQVAGALAKSHDEGIIHRDVKPENIMLTRDGHVKVLDFGLAKQAGGGALIAAPAEAADTAPGLLMGTVGYMSPEQLRGEGADARADIWSLGCVLYEMLAGRAPFDAATASEVISLILQKEPPPLASLTRDLPAELVRITSKALDKNKEGRYEVIREMLLELRDLKDRLRFEAHLGRSAAAATAPEAIRGERRSRKAIRSLAVLPFANASADSALEYLSDGITESIINTLSQLTGLRVIARSTMFRYRGRDVAPELVGRELDVRAVLTGRVLQLGERLVVSAELVDVADESQLWGERYNRQPSDIFEVQEEIAREISEALRLRLTIEQKRRLAKRHTDDAEAYRLYMLGRYYLYRKTEEGFRKSLEYFNHSISRDPNYALAYTGLADAYRTLGNLSLSPLEKCVAKAKAAATRALEIDESLAEAHASLAAILRDYDWDWRGSEAEYLRGIELNAGYPAAHWGYSIHLSILGRHDEAVAEIQRARQLDPLSIPINANVGMALLLARQYDSAVAHLRRTLEMDPAYSPAHLYLGWAYEQKGMFEEAVAEMRQFHLLRGNAEALGALGRSLALSGRRDEALASLREMEAAVRRPGIIVDPIAFAYLHLGLGDTDEVIAWLSRAHDYRSSDMTHVKAHPMFDPLRVDERFQELLRRMGLEP